MGEFLNENKYTELLVSHHIKPTTNRILVVKTLYSATRPMSLSELEGRILTINKSGIFRALILFKEHRLLHVIEDGSEGVRYELCMSHDKASDDDMHVHFHCERCGKTFCLDNTGIPPVELPDGYAMTTVNYVVKGICPECNKNSHSV